MVEGPPREGAGGPLRHLDRVVEAAIGALLVVLVATALAQVVARYVFARPFTWVLELDILLMVWATFLSGYAGVRRDAHLRVTYLLDRMTPAGRRRARLSGHVLAIVFVAVLGLRSFDVIRAMDGIDFTALPIGQAVLYWTVPVSSALMLLALVHALASEWRRPPVERPRGDAR